MEGWEEIASYSDSDSVLVTLLCVLIAMLVIVVVTVLLCVLARRNHFILAALKCENSLLFKLLLCNKDILTVRDRDRNNIFHLAASSDWTERNTLVLGEYLREKGVITQTLTREDIFKVVSGVNLESQESGESILESQNSRGETPVHVAIVNNQANIMVILIDKGVNMDVKDNRNRTPMQELNESDCIEIQRYRDRKKQVHHATTSTQNQDRGVIQEGNHKVFKSGTIQEKKDMGGFH